MSEVVRFLEDAGMSSSSLNDTVSYIMHSRDRKKLFSASIYKDVFSIGVFSYECNKSVDATVLLSVPSSMEELFYLIKIKAEDSAANFSFEERKVLDYFLEFLPLNK